MLKINHIYLGDCLEVMKRLPDESVDLIVTDPPYQLASITKERTDSTAVKGRDGKENPFCRPQAKKGFMGKEWDVLPEVPVLKECLRVLKSGSFAFWMMTPRQDSQMEFVNRLKKAGFVISFTPIYWTYASGFPKAMNISLAIDKQECKKQLTEKLGRKPTKKEFEKVWEEFREYKEPFGREGRKEKPDGNPFNTKYLKGSKIPYHIPTTPQAKELDGSFGGFQPKPAVEVIIVSMKPLSEKSYVAQALKNKKGITWLDDVRIPFESEEDKELAKTHNAPVGTFAGGELGRGSDTSEYRLQKGRFPANLLVSDDVLNDGRIYKSTAGEPNLEQYETNDKWVYNWSKGGIYRSGFHYQNSGSFSRYFDIDKWWEQKIKELPESAQKTFPFLIVPKASSSEKNEGLDEFEEKQWRGTYKDQSKMGILDLGNSPKLMSKNIHPTVKPIKIMSYLITLGSRENDIILDPFIGSGTTAIASRLLNRKFIGIERDKEYHKIALARVKRYIEQKSIGEFGK